jgi:hypothetical protein
MSLPPWFTSLYRLTLRSVSASALHQPRAVRSLRRLWRPVFEDAAHATKHAEFSTGTNAEAAESWLKEWQIRSVCFTFILLPCYLKLVHI